MPDIIKGRMIARVIDEEYGLNEYKDVKAVRIRSKGYVLLIMEDYVPTIGEIDGDVTFLLSEDEKVYKGVNGYFKHQKNEFTLIIKSYKKDE